MSKGKPIILIAWLDPSEEDECRKTFDCFKEIFDIEYVFCDQLDGLEKVREKYLAWSSDNEHAQYVYIGTHGDLESVGPEDNIGMTWDQLWQLLLDGQHLMKPQDAMVDVIFGACLSAAAAKAWSARLGSSLIRPPVRNIISFDGSPDETEVQTVLNALAESLSKLETNHDWVRAEQCKIKTCLAAHRWNERHPQEYEAVSITDL